MNKNVIKPRNRVIKSDQNCFGQKGSFFREFGKKKAINISNQRKNGEF